MMNRDCLPAHMDQQEIKELYELSTAWDRQREAMVDEPIPGAALANTFRNLLAIKGIACTPRSEACAWCSKTADADNDLLLCQRCRADKFCDRGCFKLAWKGDANRQAHKQTCTSREQRVALVLDLLYNEGGCDFKPAAEAALESTGERVHAAYLLLQSLSGMAEVLFSIASCVSTEDMLAHLCGMLRILFGAKVGASDINAVLEKLPRDELDKFNALCAEVEVSAETKNGLFQLFFGEFDDIYRELVDDGIMGGLMLVRHSGDTSCGTPPTHASNHDLLEYVYNALYTRGKIDELPYSKIRRFWALVDELLTPPINYAPEDNNGIPESVLKPIHNKLRKKVEATWIRCTRVRGDDEDDATILLNSRATELFSRLNVKARGDAWWAIPGQWISKNHPSNKHLIDALLPTSQIDALLPTSQIDALLPLSEHLPCLPSHLQIGKRVRITGLITACHHNGTTGLVVRKKDATDKVVRGRVFVLLDTPLGKKLSLKFENVVECEILSCETDELVGEEEEAEEEEEEEGEGEWLTEEEWLTDEDETCQ